MEPLDSPISEFSLSPASLSDIDGHHTLLQTGFWATVKSFFGQTPYPFLLTMKDEPNASRPLLVLVRPFGKVLSLAYVPYGPLPSRDGGTGPFTPVPENAHRFLISLADKVKPYLPKCCVFIRFDIPWECETPESCTFPLPLMKAPTDIQPSSTVILDITGTEDEILSRMKSKTRYNIRLAFRKGVTVREGTEDELDIWYDLYRQTAERDKIEIHSFDYYKKMLSLASVYGGKTAGPMSGAQAGKQPGSPAGPPAVKLLLAEIDTVVVAGIIVAFHGAGATYLYGASSNTKRNYMPNYALQWRSIELARDYGCRWYDLFGIPPEAHPDQAMFGLYRFKVGFGGRIVHRPGCWDVPLRSGFYSAYRFAERLRHFYYKTIKKRTR